MVSTASPRIARACSSNCESRCERSVTRPLSYGRGPDVGEVDLIAAHQQLHPEHATPAERVDDARRDRLRRIKGGGRHLLRLPRLQHVAVGLAVADRLAEIHRGTRRSGGADGQQRDLEVDLDDRLGHHPVVRDAARGDGAVPGRLDVVDAQQHRLAVTGCRRDRLDDQRETRVLGHRGQLLHRPGEPERRGGQPELVGGQPAQALAVDGQPRAARRRKHLDVAALGDGDQRVGRDDARLRDDVARVLLLDERGQLLGVVHLDDGGAVGHAVRGGVRIAVDGDDVGTEPLERQRQLAAQFTGAQQHHGGSRGRRGVVVRDRLRRGRRIAFSRFTHRASSLPDASAQSDVDVAPPPVLPRLGGAHHRMTGRVEMFARMLVWARIAAPDVAARQAHAQVRPRSLAELVALLAFAGRERFRLDRGCGVGGEVFACFEDRRGAGIAPA